MPTRSTSKSRDLAEKDLIAIHFVHSVLYGLRGNEARIQPMLEAVEISPELLLDPQAKVSAGAFAQLWRDVVRENDDEFFLCDSKRMPSGSFGLICHALLVQPTLGKALRHCLGYLRLFLADIEGKMLIRGERAVVVMENRIGDPIAREVAEETFLVVIVGVLSWLGGQPLVLRRSTFGWPEPPHAADYLPYWGPNMVFGADCTEIEFDADWVTRPVVQDLENLKTFLRDAPQSMFIRFRNHEGLGAQLYRRLRGQPPAQWPTLDELAAEFDITAVSLRRRLRKQGLAYQGMKDEVRRTLACQYLRDTDMSVDAIAGEVGFNEPSAFHRAFKQWVGVSPGHFRRDARSGVAY